jgi:group I intron endonuclease
MNIRWNAHKRFLRRGVHHSPFLQSAWQKHGEAAFVFEVIEVVTDVALLLDREQFWIDQLGGFVANGGMNASKVAGSPSWHGKKLTEEHRIKIGNGGRGQKRTQETKDKIRSWHVGRPRSAETKAKLSAANLGKKLSPELKERLRINSTGRKRTIESINKTRAIWLGRKHSAKTIAKLRGRKSSKVRDHRQPSLDL